MRKRVGKKKEKKKRDYLKGAALLANKYIRTPLLSHHFQIAFSQCTELMSVKNIPKCPLSRGIKVACPLSPPMARIDGQF